MQSIEKIANHFTPIYLKDMDNVKLMNRTDTKYFFHADHLPQILPQLLEHYAILEIDSNRCMTYESTYFDTDNFDMYVQHQNGKKNRYKIRKRQYVDSSVSFLEVKFKNNKGRTIKKRIPNENLLSQINAQEDQFVMGRSPFKSDDLRAVTQNNFQRITLVNKRQNERITIDMNLSYNDLNKQTIRLNDLVIIEVKKDSSVAKSKMQEVLINQRIKENKFSKYLVGTMLLYPHLKYNRVKRIILSLKKMNIQPLIFKNNEPSYAN